MPRDFEARRKRGIRYLKNYIHVPYGHSTDRGDKSEGACLAVLEAEPKRRSRLMSARREWQRLCTIILDGLGGK